MDNKNEEQKRMDQATQIQLGLWPGRPISFPSKRSTISDLYAVNTRVSEESDVDVSTPVPIASVNIGEAVSTHQSLATDTGSQSIFQKLRPQKVTSDEVMKAIDTGSQSIFQKLRPQKVTSDEVMKAIDTGSRSIFQNPRSQALGKVEENKKIYSEEYKRRHPFWYYCIRCQEEKRYVNKCDLVDHLKKVHESKTAERDSMQKIIRRIF